jgi:hypothetical protein
VFADVTERLAAAIFLLRQSRGVPDVDFEQIFRKKFSQMLVAFKAEVKEFGMRSAPPLAHEISELKTACDDLSRFSCWRNDRVHARVRQLDDGFALYNGKTGKRLSITSQECDDILKG